MAVPFEQPPLLAPKRVIVILKERLASWAGASASSFIGRAALAALSHRALYPHPPAFATLHAPNHSSGDERPRMTMQRSRRHTWTALLPSDGDEK